MGWLGMALQDIVHMTENHEKCSPVEISSLNLLLACDIFVFQTLGLFYTLYSALQNYSSPLAFFLFGCITTCNLNRFLLVFHVMDIHKIVQIGEVKW